MLRSVIVLPDVRGSVKKPRERLRGSGTGGTDDGNHVFFVCITTSSQGVW